MATASTSAANEESGGPIYPFRTCTPWEACPRCKQCQPVYRKCGDCGEAFKYYCGLASCWGIPLAQPLKYGIMMCQRCRGKEFYDPADPLSIDIFVEMEMWFIAEDEAKKKNCSCNDQPNDGIRREEEWSFDKWLANYVFESLTRQNVVVGQNPPEVRQSPSERLTFTPCDLSYRITHKLRNQPHVDFRKKATPSTSAADEKSRGLRLQLSVPDLDFEAPKMCSTCKQYQPVCRKCRNCPEAFKYFCVSEDCWGIQVAKSVDDGKNICQKCMGNEEPKDDTTAKYYIPVDAALVDIIVESEMQTEKARQKWAETISKSNKGQGRTEGVVDVQLPSSHEEETEEGSVNIPRKKKKN